MQTDGDVPEWRQVDDTLVSLAARRAALDVEEATWLVAAKRTEVHKHVGFASLLEYVERRLGYGPHAAMERIRVALELEALPVTRGALADGRLSYSAVRELTRVANPETEAAWVEVAEGKTLRELEPRTAGRKKGDLPSAAPDPELIRHVVRYEVSATTAALLREVRNMLDTEAGERLDDDALVAAMCRAVLDGPSDADSGRARHQIAVTTCESCNRTWQDGGGVQFEVSPAEREVCRCDAMHIGRLDAQHPERASKDITDTVRRLVRARDHGRCVVPGCRASRFLDLHHIRWRSMDGEHTPDNLILCCWAHHRLIHEGKVIVNGTVSTGVDFRHADGRPYGQREPHHQVVANAVSALHHLGYKPHEARAAIEEATSHVGRDASTLELISVGLRSLKPRGTVIVRAPDTPRGDVPRGTKAATSRRPRG